MSATPSRQDHLVMELFALNATLSTHVAELVGATNATWMERYRTLVGQRDHLLDELEALLARQRAAITELLPWALREAERFVATTKTSGPNPAVALLDKIRAGAFTC